MAPGGRQQEPQQWFYEAGDTAKSGNEGGSCLEVLDGHPMGVPIRDSKAPHGPALVFPTTD
ncbi:DUF397 domain-containing protein [Streptomyces sp. G5(2025)]|uniref:DUF397 domain-containing protein n=1 Tax=Streptomyces sp. G5(2025) TaxID=3406628 RepID=UPI003C167F46